MDNFGNEIRKHAKKQLSIIPQTATDLWAINQSEKIILSQNIVTSIPKTRRTNCKL